MRDVDSDVPSADLWPLSREESSDPTKRGMLHWIGSGCPLCDENAEASPIAFDEEWPNPGPPCHTNCDCSIEWVWDDEAGPPPEQQEVKAPGEELRDFVQPLMLNGDPYPEGADVYAVDSKVGQIRCFFDQGLSKAERPSEDQIQRALSTLADISERNPIGEEKYGRPVAPSMNIVSKARGLEDSGDRYATAYTQQGGPSTINVVGKKPFGNVGASNFMPATRGTEGRGTFAHEYGHLHDFERKGGLSRTSVYQSVMNLAKKGGLSKYGQTNAYEAYAESFAEWQMSNGTTENLAAKAYAEAFGW